MPKANKHQAVDSQGNEIPYTYKQICACGHPVVCDCHRGDPDDRGAPCGNGRHPYWDKNDKEKWDV